MRSEELDTVPVAPEVRLSAVGLGAFEDTAEWRIKKKHIQPHARSEKVDTVPVAPGGGVGPEQGCSGRVAARPAFAGVELHLPAVGLGGSSDTPLTHIQPHVRSVELETVPVAPASDTPASPERLTGLVNELEEEVRAVLGDVKMFINTRPDLPETSVGRFSPGSRWKSYKNGAGSPKAASASASNQPEDHTAGGLTAMEMPEAETLVEEVPAMVQQSCSILCRTMSSSASDSSLGLASKNGTRISPLAAQMAARQRFKAEQKTRRRVAGPS